MAKPYASRTRIGVNARPTYPMQSGIWSEANEQMIPWDGIRVSRNGDMARLIQWQDPFGPAEDWQHYLFRSRWPKSLACSTGYGTPGWTVRRSCRIHAFYACSAYRHQDSITARKIFHRTKLLFPIWILAIFLISVDTEGKSALALSRALGWQYDVA